MTIDAGLKPEGAPERSPIAGAGAPSGVDAGPKRYSVQRKMAVVARLLRGEPLDVVAREANVSVAKLTEWRERALAGAASALKERERDDREDEIVRLKSQGGRDHHGQRIAVRQDRRHGGQKPFGPKEVETMSQTVSPSTSRCYGLARVSRAWSVSRAGVYRFLKGTPSPAIARRPGPTGPCPDADLADHIRREIEASDFHGEGYRKLWARLRVAGFRSSPRRVRRVMGENGLLAPHRVGRNQEKTHDGTIVTDMVNEMWGTDMSQTVTLEEGRAYVFVAVEHANSEIIGIHAARSANRFEALEPVRQGVHRCFGSIAPGVARGLKLRHDHGSNYMSGDFQGEIKCLGIEASPSFVREPEGNGVAERFIRTLKENLLWVRTFKTIEELRAELVAFARRYNETWLVARHGYKTPARLREEQTMPPIAIDPTLAATLPLAA